MRPMVPAWLDYASGPTSNTAAGACCIGNERCPAKVASHHRRLQRLIAGFVPFVSDGALARLLAAWSEAVGVACGRPPGVRTLQSAGPGDG